MSPGRTEVCVLGAGLEGLVTAAFLARAGRTVCVVDSTSAVGGHAARHEFHPGYSAPGLLHEVGSVRRELLAPLALEEHGLVWNETERPLFVPADEGVGILLHHDPGLLRAELPPENARDVQAYADWRAFLGKMRELVVGVLDEPPPQAEKPGPGELWRLAKRGLQLRRLGDRDMLELMAIVPKSADDWLNELFEHEGLKVGLASQALVGTVLGPRAAGTSALLFLRQVAQGPEPKGGPAALVEALEACCRAHGVTFRLETAVESIRVEAGRAKGVELTGGEVIEARTVASALDLRRTLLELVPPHEVPIPVEGAALGWRMRGATAAVRFALSAPPSFLGRENKSIERAVTAGSLIDLERGSDHLKYGRMPDRVWLDLGVPSHADPSLAPAGHAVVSALVHCVPHDLAGGWNDAARDRLGDLALDELARVAPGVRDAVLGREVLSPRDVEERFGLTGGHVYQGELALDQLWVQRPSLRLSRYRTPIEGLYLCGSGSHPGGPFVGGAGALAARAILG